METDSMKKLSNRLSHHLNEIRNLTIRVRLMELEIRKWREGWLKTKDFPKDWGENKIAFAKRMFMNHICITHTTAQSFFNDIVRILSKKKEDVTHAEDSWIKLHIPKSEEIPE